MLSLRSLGRAAPRALPRLSRPATTLFRSPPSTTARATYASILPRASTRAFTVSAVRAAEETSGEVDAELSAKLESEIQFEEEVSQEEQMPATIKDFLASGLFEVVDVEGKEEVRLVRNHGDEKITVSFSVTELPYQDEDMMEDDQAFDDSENPDRARQNESEDDIVEDDDFSSTPPTPTHLTVVVEKPSKGPGALSVECTAQDGAIVIDNVHYYADAAQAFASTPEASHARVDAYPGPSFATLDEDLQVLMEQYLEERGVGAALASFTPDYIDFKEQKEYQRWLKNVKNFVDL